MHLYFFETLFIQSASTSKTIEFSLAVSKLKNAKKIKKQKFF